MSAIFNRIFRANTGLAATHANKPPETPLTRFFDSVKIRIGLTATLSILYLVNLILAGTAFHVSPSGVYGALAWQIILSLGIWIYSLVFFWRNLNGVEEKRILIWFWMNVAIILLWLTGFFSLAIMLGKTPDSLDFKADGNNATTYHPAIGCLIFNLAFSGIFGVNAAYVFIRMRQLFPKYAEIAEEQQAFDAAMTEGDYTGHADEEEGHGNIPPTAQFDQPGSTAYGQPGAQYDQPPRYDQPPTQYQPPSQYEGQGYDQPVAYPPEPAAYSAQPPYTAYQPGRQGGYPGAPRDQVEPRYPAEVGYTEYGGHQPFPSGGA